MSSRMWSREHLEVVDAIAQRRQLDRQHREPVVEVGAEAAHRDHLAQVHARRGDHAHVHLGHAVGAQRLDFLLLQHAQQLRLHAMGMSPTSSRKSVPPLASTNLPSRPRRSRRCRPAEAPKNSASSSVSGMAATFTRDERPVGARAGRVDRLGEHFLAGAGLAQQQHGGVGLRRAARLALGFHRGGRGCRGSSRTCTSRAAPRRASSACRRARSAGARTSTPAGAGAAGWSKIMKPAAPITRPRSSLMGMRITTKDSSPNCMMSSMIGSPVRTTSRIRLLGITSSTILPTASAAIASRQARGVLVADPDDARVAIDDDRAFAHLRRVLE